MNKRKVALITGVTGQDGSYLAEFLLEKGYEVHGIKRRSSSFNTQRVDHIFQDPHSENNNFYLHYGDLSDSSNLTRILSEVRPDEVYNLAAQSHVAVSFESPEYTADVDAIGTLRLLDAIRFLGLKNTKRTERTSASRIASNCSSATITIGFFGNFKYRVNVASDNDFRRVSRRPFLRENTTVTAKVMVSLPGGPS